VNETISELHYSKSTGNKYNGFCPVKIPKGYSEAANRRTDNAIAKRRKSKRQTIAYTTQHRKLQIAEHEPH
jgi:hypothetical protein